MIISNEILATLDFEGSGAEMLRLYNHKYRHSSQFVEVMRKELSLDYYWKLTQRFFWNSLKAAPITQTLTMRGFGYTFNMMDDEKLLNFSK
jgi:hypothetical protein